MPVSVSHCCGDQFMADSTGRVWRTYNIITLNPICLSPRTHNKRIIICHHCNDIDTFTLQCGEIIEVPWEMAGWAGGGECAWDCEEDDFLVGPFYQMPWLVWFPGIYEALGRWEEVDGYCMREEGSCGTFASIILDRWSSRCDTTALWSVRDVAEYHVTWEAISSFEFGHCCCCIW